MALSDQARARRVAERVFLCRARRESREHVARSWRLCAELAPSGQADDGQTIREIAKREKQRAARFNTPAPAPEGDGL